jgi:hypothetical protein
MQPTFLGRPARLLPGVVTTRRWGRRGGGAGSRNGRRREGLGEYTEAGVGGRLRIQISGGREDEGISGRTKRDRNGKGGQGNS